MHALVIRAGEDAWLNLSRWALNWMHGGRHGAGSRPRGSQTDLGTESTQPSTAQLEAIARLQNDIHDFASRPTGAFARLEISPPPFSA